MPASPGIGPDAASLGRSRRHATRFEPVRRDACLAWSETSAGQTSDVIAQDVLIAQEPRHHFALLIDISQTGASLALDKVPVDDESVWMRLEGEGFSDWTEAEVVGVTTTMRGPHLVRLAFRTPCPFETLKSAICE